MAGIRWRIDCQHRYTPVDAIAPYYWTSVYYFENLGSTPFTGPNYNAILDTTYACSLDDVALVAIRQFDTTHNSQYGIATPLSNLGELDAEDGGSLLNVIRLSGRAAGKEVSYKLWRFPLRLSDIEGERLSDQALDIVNDTLIPGLNDALLCNKNGVAIDEWTCDHLVHGWQLRHGTKRRQRVVFAYP
jgi:hypothetical protein